MILKPTAVIRNGSHYTAFRARNVGQDTIGQDTVKAVVTIINAWFYDITYILYTAL